MDGYTDTSYEWAETVRMAISALSAIENIKAEIDEQEFTHHNGLTYWYMTPSEVKSIVFEIIDKHISGSEIPNKLSGKESTNEITN